MSSSLKELRQRGKVFRTDLLDSVADLLFDNFQVKLDWDYSVGHGRDPQCLIVGVVHGRNEFLLLVGNTKSHRSSCGGDISIIRLHSKPVLPNDYDNIIPLELRTISFMLETDNLEEKIIDGFKKLSEMELVL